MMHRNFVLICALLGFFFVAGGASAQEIVEDDGDGYGEARSIGADENVEDGDSAESGIAEDEALRDEEHRDDEKPKTQTAKVRTVNMDQKITLDLRNMDVNDALTYLSLRSGANIVASKAVTGRVTLQLKDVSLRDVFDITLLTNSLAYEERGDIYYVMTDKEYEARYGRNFSDIREVKMYELQYAIPEKAFDLLDTLKSKIGRILVDQESGTVLMLDTSEKIKEMSAALATMEKKGDVIVFDLQYAVALDVAEQLRAELDDKNVGSIWSDERSNQVFVQALPERMDDVKQVIAALDRKTREVLIDAKIVRIKLSDQLEAGIQWEGLFKDLVGGGYLGSHPLQPVERLGTTFIDDFTTIQPEDANPSAGAKTTFTEKVFFGVTENNKSFEALFNFLATLGEARILSNPRLAVINNQEARIHVGRKEAYITTTTTAGQTTTTTAEDVTFVDVGIQLSVTPTINEEGFVTMKVKPEVSSVVDILITPSGNQIPILDTSLAETTVLVKDNSTIIIGGLRREEKITAAERIPFLGDIPILGHAFRQQTTSTERSELLVMISPHIVDGTIIDLGGDVNPGEEGAKPFKDYDTFQPPGILEGPGFGNLEYKSYRD